MPANMMMEPAGSSLKVIGRSSATVSAGPMPGSTPTAVPRRTPMSAKSRFIGWMATVRPWGRETKASMAASDQAFEGPRRQGQGQELREEDMHHDRDAQADEEIDHEGAAPERRGGGGKQQRRSDHEAAADADEHDQHREP